MTKHRFDLMAESGTDDYALLSEDEPRVGYDIPLPNGCWKCIGCGKILAPSRRWNQCSECDTREPEDY